MVARRYALAAVAAVVDPRRAGQLGRGIDHVGRGGAAGAGVDDGDVQRVRSRAAPARAVARLQHADFIAAGVEQRLLLPLQRVVDRVHAHAVAADVGDDGLDVRARAVEPGVQQLTFARRKAVVVHRPALQRAAVRRLVAPRLNWTCVVRVGTSRCAHAGVAAAPISASAVARHTGRKA